MWWFGLMRLFFLRSHCPGRLFLPARYSTVALRATYGTLVSISTPRKGTRALLELIAEEWGLGRLSTCVPLQDTLIIISLTFRIHVEQCIHLYTLPLALKPTRKLASEEGCVDRIQRGIQLSSFS